MTLCLRWAQYGQLSSLELVPSPPPVLSCPRLPMESAFLKSPSRFLALEIQTTMSCTLLQMVAPLLLSVASITGAPISVLPRVSLPSKSAWITATQALSVLLSLGFGVIATWRTLSMTDMLFAMFGPASVLRVPSSHLHLRSGCLLLHQLLTLLLPTQLLRLWHLRPLLSPLQ